MPITLCIRTASRLNKVLATSSATIDIESSTVRRLLLDKAKSNGTAFVADLQNLPPSSDKAIQLVLFASQRLSDATHFSAVLDWLTPGLEHASKAIFLDVDYLQHEGKPEDALGKRLRAATTWFNGLTSAQKTQAKVFIEASLTDEKLAYRAYPGVDEAKRFRMEIRMSAKPTKGIRA